MNFRSLALLVVVGACGPPDDPRFVVGDVIRQDDASDELLRVIADEASRELVVDPTQAATLTAPVQGEAVAGDPAYTFTWELPPASRPVPRHGRQDGTFVWLHLEAPGLDPGIDVISIDSTSWTPDDFHWPRLQGATGPIKATLITAVAEEGVVTRGPFRAAADDDVTFTVGD